jgi:organic hydroperoxide reductase OsmC/OhrA
VGRFEQVTLRPRVTIEGAENEGLARALHDDAHEQCFIANSCCVAIRHEASIATLGEAAGDGV